MKILKKQIGSTLTELLIALSVATMAVASGASLTDYAAQNIIDVKTAEYQNTFNAALAKYVKANYSVVSGAASSTVPAVISVSNLTAGGYLPAGFSSVNPYGQTPCGLALIKNTSDLSVLAVTESGQNIDSGRLRSIANKIGYTGGYIDTAASTTALGSNNGWSTSITNFVSKNCSGAAATTKHLASLLSFDNSGLTQNYLYRNGVPGHPELNTMTVPLVISSVQTVGNSCSTYPNGSIAQDSNGSLISCVSGNWTLTGGSSSNYWKDPVATYSALPSCSSSNKGEVRLVLTPTTGTGARPYTCDGTSSWAPITIADNGLINVPGTFNAGILVYGGTSSVVEGTACTVADEGKVIPSTSDGLALICRKTVSTGSTYSYQKNRVVMFLPPSPDVASLPTYYDGPIVDGSIAFVKNVQRLYIYDKTNNIWSAISQGLRFNGGTEGWNTSAIGINANKKFSNFQNVATATCTGANCVATTSCPNVDGIGTRNQGMGAVGICTGDVSIDGYQNNSGGTRGNAVYRDHWACQATSSATAKVKAIAFCGVNNN